MKMVLKHMLLVIKIYKSSYFSIENVLVNKASLHNKFHKLIVVSLTHFTIVKQKCEGFYWPRKSRDYHMT